MKSIKTIFKVVVVFYMIMSNITLTISDSNISEPTPNSNLFELRKALSDRTFDQDVTLIDKSIQIIGKEKPEERFGVCHNYAISKALGLQNNLPIVGADDWDHIFHFTENYCYEVDKPKKGDLVLYYNSPNCPIVQHTGLVYDEGLVESKWGTGSEIFVHPTFTAPSCYGDHVKYFRIRCASDATEDMKKRIERCGFTKNQCALYKNSVLYHAEHANNYEVWNHMKRIMCIPIDVVNDQNQNLLMIGAKNNNLELMRGIISCNININQQDTAGKTALHLAAEKEYFSAVSFLLQQEKCNKKIKDNAGNKALDFCYEFQNLSSAKYAVKRLAQPTKQAQQDFWDTINS